MLAPQSAEGELRGARAILFHTPSGVEDELPAAMGNFIALVAREARSAQARAERDPDEIAYATQRTMPMASPNIHIRALINILYHVYRNVYVQLTALLSSLGLPLWREPLPSLGRPVAIGKLHSIHVGAGIPKTPAARALVTRLGLAGDRQKVGWLQPWGGHGGEDKAIMLWSLDVINQVASEGHPLCQPGRCGEQLTISAVDWRLVQTGARVQIGSEVLLEITFHKMPCRAQSPNFSEAGDGMQRISPQHYPDARRVLARVLRAGHVATGDEVSVYRSPRAAPSGKLVRSKIYQTAFVNLEYN